MEVSGQLHVPAALPPGKKPPDQTGSGAHPASYTMAVSLEAKRPRREADHSPPTSVEVKNACPIRLHGVVLKYHISI